MSVFPEGLFDLPNDLLTDGDPTLRNFPLVTGVNVTHLATRCLKYVSVCVNPSDEGTTAPPYAKLNSKSTGRSEEWSAAGTRSIGGLCTLTSILVDMS